MDYLALALFAAASSLTPGPNNMMILSSGVNYGFRRSLPHWFGISWGFCFMVVAVGMGLAALFTQFPVLHTVLKVVGTLYMLWLAYKIATSNSRIEGKNGSPMTFLQACAFQWVNPKAWMMALGALSTYPVVTQPYWPQVLIVAAMFTLINQPCVGVWLAVGTGLKRYLDRPAYLKAFNYVMAALLLVSLYPIATELYAYFKNNV
jgi:threonine/homoserine/homoserine lactone efflux protein